MNAQVQISNSSRLTGDKGNVTNTYSAKHQLPSKWQNNPKKIIVIVPKNKFSKCNSTGRCLLDFKQFLLALGDGHLVVNFLANVRKYGR